jgi:hypothetical protein
MSVPGIWKPTRQKKKAASQFREPKEIQTDLGNAYFTMGQMQFGIEKLKLEINKQAVVIHNLEAELKTSEEFYSEETDVSLQA